MADYWAWMTAHWFWGGLLSFILAWSAIQTVRFVLMSFFKVFHRKEPPKITIEVREDQTVTGGDEETATTLRDVVDQLAPIVPEPVRRTSASVWERLRGNDGI